MDLEYGPEYQDFTKEVESFCEKYKGLSFTDGSNNPLGSSGSSGGPQMSRSEWQKTLIENGYFARSVPKEYGGYGGEVDILKSRIIATEFSKSNTPGAMGGQGIDMLVPTLLEICLLYTSPSPRDRQKSRMPSSA